MKLDKNKVYDLKPLNKEERKVFLQYLKNNEKVWYEVNINDLNYYIENNDSFRFSQEYNEWLFTSVLPPTTNAKELFYTLENVQVDCSGLTKEQIKEMAYMYKSKGFDIGSINLLGEYIYLRGNDANYCMVNEYDNNKTTITYEKFIELFGKEESFKQLVEVLNEELTEEAYKETEYEVKYISEKPKEHIEHNLEMADKPIQYQIGIDAIGIAEKNMTIDECLAIARFNITKYSYRKKNQDLEDFKKVIAYANWAISLLNKNNN